MEYFIVAGKAMPIYMLVVHSHILDLINQVLNKLVEGNLTFGQSQLPPLLKQQLLQSMHEGMITLIIC